MRDERRIKPFLEKIGKYWKYVPDWRFCQLITNVIGMSKVDPWYLEEDDVIELFEEFFDGNKDAMEKESEEKDL